MACGITGDYIYQRLNFAGKESEKGLDLICAFLMSDEDELREVEAKEDQEEVKGGTYGR